MLSLLIRETLIRFHSSDRGYISAHRHRINSSASEAARLSSRTHPASQVDMSGKVVAVVALVAALLASGASSAPGGPGALQRLLGPEQGTREAPGRREPVPRSVPARTERRAHLSEDEREMMTKRIMQAISEMMNSECMLSRDYQGWVDFGRRDAQ